MRVEFLMCGGNQTATPLRNFWSFQSAVNVVTGRASLISRFTDPRTKIEQEKSHWIPGKPIQSLILQSWPRDNVRRFVMVATFRSNTDTCGMDNRTMIFDRDRILMRL